MAHSCKVEDCPNGVIALGLCRMHYMRQRRKGNTDDARKNARGLCSVDDCLRAHRAFGYCDLHYRQRVNPKPLRGPFNEEGRTCDLCGAPMPSTRGATSRFCDRECKEVFRKASGGIRAASRRWRLKAEYGLTEDDFTRMLKSQGVRCAICGSDSASKRHADAAFHVDHDHKTGRVRGLLCSSCNFGLGQFKDDAEVLLAALVYLEAHAAS